MFCEKGRLCIQTVGLPLALYQGAAHACDDTRVPYPSPAKLLTRHSNPTLSYTQRLEERIKELEDQLASAKSAPPSIAASTHSSPGVFNGDSASHNRNSAHADDHGMTRSFMGLKIDDKGGITYHGPTSLFHLPSDRDTTQNDLLCSVDTDAHRRERLVTNAWHQRAMENLSDIPVCSLCTTPIYTSLPSTAGTISISPECALVLDPASVQFYLQTCFHPYAFLSCTSESTEDLT